jgi:hypothetical protein
MTYDKHSSIEVQYGPDYLDLVLNDEEKRVLRYFVLLLILSLEPVLNKSYKK